MFANVCALEHLPYMEGYVLREPSILVPVQCIQAVVADMQTRAQSVFKYQDNDTLVELTGDVSAHIFEQRDSLKTEFIAAHKMSWIPVNVNIYSDQSAKELKFSAQKHPYLMNKCNGYLTMMLGSYGDSKMERCVPTEKSYITLAFNTLCPTQH